MVLDLTNPSEKELTRLGISLKAYEENYFFTAKLGGLCRWCLFYSWLFFSTWALTFALVTTYVVFIHFQGEKETVLESVHSMLLMLNVLTMVIVYHKNQQSYLQLYRAFDKGVHEYCDPFDDEILEDIEGIRKGAKERKRKFGFFYATLLKIAFVAHTSKKPINWLLYGGKTSVDGEGNLMWQSVFGVYMPFANYWGPYIFGHLLSILCATFVALTAVASTTTFQFISEEMLAEYAIVKLTFEKSVVRAEHLYKTRENHVDFKTCLRLCVNDSVEHHQRLLRLFEIFKKMMKIPLFVVIFDGGLVLCISSYLTIRDDVSMQLRLTMPTLVLANSLLMFIFCHYGEKLSAANADVGDGLFNADKLTDHLILLRGHAVTVKRFSNVHKELTAGGFSAVNHKTFAYVVRAAYSYIGFMLST